MHKTGNVLNCLPKASRRPSRASRRSRWLHAFDDCLERYADKYPKAAACLARDRQEALAFYDFPGVHWTHLRMTNVIESSFATIRHRSKPTKG